MDSITVSNSKENAIVLVETKRKRKYIPHGKVGRPPKFKIDIIDDVEKLASTFCASDATIATYLGVNKATFCRWKKKHPEIAEARRRGKSKAKLRFVTRLCSLADTGDLAAIKFILCNRYKKLWTSEKIVSLTNTNINTIGQNNDADRNSDEAITERRELVASFRRLYGNGESVQE